MTNNELIDESIAILQTMNAEDCAAAIEELRNELASSPRSLIARLIAMTHGEQLFAMTLELERVKGIARDRLATIAKLRRPISDFGMEDELEASLSPDGNDGLYGAYLRGELDL